MKHELEIDVRFAREILACESGAEGDRPSTLGAAATSVDVGARALVRMNEQLVRWFGPDGVDALLVRALERARRTHPVLERVQRHAKGELRLAGMAERRQAESRDGLKGEPGYDETAEAVAVLIATILALIARLVGEDMTRHLILQIWPGHGSRTELSPKGSNSNRSNNEGRDT